MLSLWSYSHSSRCHIWFVTHKNCVQRANQSNEAHFQSVLETSAACKEKRRLTLKWHWCYRFNVVSARNGHVFIPWTTKELSIPFFALIRTVHWIKCPFASLFASLFTYCVIAQLNVICKKNDRTFSQLIHVPSVNWHKKYRPGSWRKSAHFMRCTILASLIWIWN